MKLTSTVLATACLLAGCVTSGSPPSGKEPFGMTGGLVSLPDVMPPQCGLPPNLPAEFAGVPNFKARVVVGFLLAPSGEISNVRLVRSSGHAQLDSATLAQVRRWRCPSTSRRPSVQPAEVALDFQSAQPQSDDGKR